MEDHRADDGWTIVRRRRGRLTFRDPPAAIQPVSPWVRHPPYPHEAPIRRTVASGLEPYYGEWTSPPPRARGREEWRRGLEARGLYPGRDPWVRDPQMVPHHVDQAPRRHRLPPTEAGRPQRDGARRYSPVREDLRRRGPDTRGLGRTYHPTPRRVQDHRNRPPTEGDRRRRQNVSRAGDTSHRRYENERGPPNAPNAPRSSDPDFSVKNKLIFSIVKALHHLDNVMAPDPPVTITRMARALAQVVKPAAPTPTTLALIRGNAENWAYTTTIILRDHYQDSLENHVQMFSLLTGPEWAQNFEIASAWAKRHFGPRLSQGTLDATHARLRLARDGVGPPTDPPPDGTPGRRPATATATTPPRPPAPPAALLTGDPVTVTAQIHAPRDGGCLPVTPPPPSFEPSADAVRREGGSSEPRPYAEGTRSPVAPLPSPVSPLLFDPLLSTPPPPPQPPTPLPPVFFPPEFFPPFSGSEASPSPPKAQRSTRTRRRPLDPSGSPAISSRPASPAAVVTADEAPQVHSPTGEAHTSAVQQPAVTRRRTQSRLSFATPPATTPPTPTRRPTRHINTTNKAKEWCLQARGKWLILGDSNTSRFPPFQHPDLQIDSYPGATFRHAVSILAKTTVSTGVEKVILAFGLNDRTHRTDQTVIRQLQGAVKMAKTTFPQAQIFLPEINFSRSLPHREQDNLRRLNAHITSQRHFIPALARNSFNTDRDGVHWTHPTAKLVLEHWLEALN